ncbi:unnamed protein product [Acanthoscelides obtectus]|uniref:Uncharacterized protein n=1 Tax=Acanthoscelides obtectus TaxID=200917 RepID=A0A9P0K500_ACAOB|nr:unnamed protein product [Acanthoscelides obtectus]CAK1658697.1 hypothetical protein AOBTE_LOCUS21071 [Acanthoscelides obtectus]
MLPIFLDRMSSQQTRYYWAWLLPSTIKLQRLHCAKVRQEEGKVNEGIRLGPWPSC